MSTDDPQIAVELQRQVNDRIRARAARVGGDGPSRFICECGDPACLETVVLSPSAFDARRRSGVPSRIVAHRPA